MDSAGSDELGGGFGGDSPAAALADLASALDRVAALSGGDLWDHETRDLLAGLEVGARRIDAARVAVLGQVQRSGLYQVDGHASAKVMVRHTCRLSGVEAARRERVEEALRYLPLVDDAYRAGSIGTEQVDLVAKVYRNKRVREALVGFQAEVLVMAAECEYPVFESVLRQWERATDDDGPAPKDDRAHKDRHLSLKQNPESLAWKLDGSLGALPGAKVDNLLRRLVDREREADWAKARAEHGDSACAADLERTEAQRWADALARMADLAASADPEAQGPGSEHVIVWDSETYLSTVHRVTCTDPHCDAEAHGNSPSSLTNKWYDPTTYRCETIDGKPLEPVEAVLDSFHHHVRVVLVTGGQPTAVGSKRRLFTGRNRLAVKLQSRTCLWPGCWVPTSVCEADHAHPHAAGGKTQPQNGIPLCGRHNRWKQKGYTTGRDPDTRRWRTYRPDGTEIP